MIRHLECFCSANLYRHKFTRWFVGLKKLLKPDITQSTSSPVSKRVECEKFLVLRNKSLLKVHQFTSAMSNYICCLLSRRSTQLNTFCIVKEFYKRP